MLHIEMRPRRHQQGWTYLWLLMTIALISLGLTVVVEINATNVQRDKEKELIAIGSQFRNAIEQYSRVQVVVGEIGTYPARLEDLLQDTRTGVLKRHLRQIFIDPMTGRAEWGLVMHSGRIVGVHSLASAIPLKRQGFNLEDSTFTGKQSYRQWVFSPPSASAIGTVRN